MIEDDEELAEIISKYLRSFDIEVTNASEPYMGLSLLDVQKFDLLILDLTLPGIDGLELIPKIRKKSDIPIIVSTARGDIVDKVVGLQRGADDYMPKPYDPRELEARIKSILRRQQTIQKNFANKDNILVVDQAGLQIKYKDKVLSLTPAEFDILAMLIKNKNRSISRESFIYESKHIDDNSSLKNIDVMVSRIRAKLAAIDPDSVKIKTVRGFGYQLIDK